MAYKFGCHLAFTNRKPDKKIVRKMTVRKPDRSVFGGLLYLYIKQSKAIQNPDFFVRFSNGFKKMAAKAISKTGHKKCLKNDNSNTGRSGIRWFTVSIFSPFEFWTCPEF
jgi:hypothetical protein